jgi:hypothetical protein
MLIGKNILAWKEHSCLARIMLGEMTRIAAF